MSEPVDKVRLFLRRAINNNTTADSKSLCAQGYVTYAIYVTLGAGLLFPWNAFITAADYFELEFPVCLLL